MTNISKHPEYYNYDFKFKDEEWKFFGNPKFKHKQYMVSNYGRVFSIIYGQVLRLRTRRHGYFSFAYYNSNQKPTNLSIHRVVASLFCDNPNNHNNVNHIDGDKQNNFYKNLEWCTHRQNIQHAHNNGLVSSARGERVNTAKLKEGDVVEIRKKYKPFKYTARMLSEEYGMSITQIKYIIRRKSWKHVK